MKNPTRLLLLGVLASVLAACAPAAISAQDEPAVIKPVQNTVAPPQQATEAPLATNVPLAAPTSRGDQLVATDPASVNLASGKPALVEFFRFT